jgi:hypothetical protein
MKRKLLVIGAHSGDFVWRAAGTIAKAIEEGAETLVICLSYGERGESGELWKEDPKRSIENVKQIRHEQAQKAADILGTPIQFLNWGDYPMLISDERIEQLTHLIGDYDLPQSLRIPRKTLSIQIIHSLSRQPSVHVYYLVVLVFQALSKISTRLFGTLLNPINRNFADLCLILL